MKILLDLRCLSQPKTGIQIVAANFLDGLLHGAACEKLLVLASDGDEIDSLLDESQVIRTHIAPYDFRRQSEVAALINACAADVVLSPTYFMPFGVRKPYIITVHDLIPRKVWLGAPSLYVWGFLGSRMRQARSVWTVSEYSRSEILRHYPRLRGRIQVVPSGYVGELERPPLDKTERTLLLFGSRFRHKNIGFALRAFGILQELSRDAWELHIVGNASCIQDTSLPAGVCFRGRVTDDELTRLYWRCWGLLLPSVEEGFSLPLLEGMSHGCVVFYHRQTAMRETAGNAGIGLDLRRPEDWANAILMIAENPGQTEQHRKCGLDRASEFTRTRFATAMKHALARSLEGWISETELAEWFPCP